MERLTCRLLSLIFGLGLSASGAIAAPDGEIVPPDEAANTALLVQGLETVVKTEHPARRDAHAKGHGCVKGDFTVDPDLPASLRQGVFAAPRVFKAWVRFSNSSGLLQGDAIGDAHGMAIKLLDVAGPKVLQEEAGARTQDFVLLNNPVFFITNVADYVAFIPFVAQHKEEQYFAVRPRQGAAFKAVNRLTTSVLDQRFFSTTPYLLGETIIKMAANPIDCATGAGLTAAQAKPPADRPNFLREGMVNWLHDKDACFTVAVQPQTNPTTQPVEDPTIEWKESEAPFLDVARLRIPRQTFDTPAQQAFCENLSFTPWHALAVERPLGGINRVRKPIYRAISNLRHKVNGTPHTEPTGEETFP